MLVTVSVVFTFGAGNKPKGKDQAHLAKRKTPEPCHHNINKQKAYDNTTLLPSDATRYE